MSNVTADISELKKLEGDINRMTKVAIGRLAERGRILLRKEVPKQTTNLQQGVAAPFIDQDGHRATLTVSAIRARRGPRSATVHLPSGKTKKITLRAVNEFDYAEVVAKGRPAINPRDAKFLIIPVSSAPSGESYIESGGQIYIVRKSAKAVKANPYDERAAKQLQEETVAIVGAVAQQFKL
jgi:hypothetical protein